MSSFGVYPQDFHSRIGFDTVLGEVAQHLQTLGGEELLTAIDFSADVAEVTTRISQCAEMAAVLSSGEEFPSAGYVDICDLVDKLRVDGAYIDGLEIVRLASGVELVGGLLDFFGSEERRAQFPTLAERSASVVGCSVVAVEARRIVDKHGVVRDGASPRLAEIRQALALKSKQISTRLQQILQRAKSEGFTPDDSSVSIRDGRAVIPVSAGHKRKVAGMIFDESATGKTAYVEPLEVIELNNEVRELLNDQRIEIVRVLIGFAAWVRESLDDLADLGDYLCFVDFVVAKARYAQQIGGVQPQISPRPELNYIDARHPILQALFRADGREGELVPLDISLGGEAKPLLLISGPNAGGKSVCLKSVGLLQYMFQCGLLPSVDAESTFGVFESIFLDIGDQQSIDNDLSTYSSHLTNMKVMLRGATDRSLILLDEFGAGTEPGVGGAIAEAILGDFVHRKVVGVVTTHYANLKYYAAASTGIENGAMTFDVQKIAPLYKLQIGIPGNSYAFEIARKIGLPNDVLHKAEELLGEDKLSLDKQLRDAQRDKKYWEQKRESIRLANKSATKVADEYSTELEQLRQKRKELLADARQQAAQIIKDAGALIENTIREIKEAAAEKERTKTVRQKVEKFKEELQSEVAPDPEIERKIELLRNREKRRAQRSEERKNEVRKPTVKPPVPKVLPIVEGALVQVDGQGNQGRVIRVNGNKTEVAFGALKSTVETKRLKVMATPGAKTRTIVDQPQAASTGNLRIQSAMEFSPQLDIRGMRVMEAMDEVQQFIDRAIMLGQQKVRILHGKGTGALKEEVRRYLRSEPAVTAATDEAIEMGGAGITVVEF